MRKLNSEEFLKLLKDEGIVVDCVVMDFQRFVKKCLMFGFEPNSFLFLF